MKQRTYFSADHHFGHERIMPLTDRPFRDASHMREQMIDRWNEVVQPGDTVWYLGDFAYRASPEETAAIFLRLNGEKHLIVGNHDNAATQALPWASVAQMAEIVVDGQRIALCHYPLLEWPHYYRGAWHVFGHVHGSREYSCEQHSCDVGVDVWDYRPASFGDVRRRLEARIAAR